MALPFVAVGGFFALAGFEFVPLPGKANAPLPVIGFIGLAFFLAGSTLLSHGARGLLNEWRIRRRPLSEPWLVDYPWNPRGIRDRAGARVLNALLGLLLFTVFLVPFNWWAFISDHGSWLVTFVVGTFDLILAVILGKAIYHLGQYVKFGHSRLTFRRFPYHPGETLLVAFSGTPLERLNATLRFVEERVETTGTGDDRSTRLVSYEHFGQQKEFVGTSGMPEIEIDFEIPDNPEWVTGLSSRPVRYWELLLESEQTGIDFRTTFPLPIYDRG